MNSFREFHSVAITNIQHLESLVNETKNGLEVWAVYALGARSFKCKWLIPHKFYPGTPQNLGIEIDPYAILNCFHVESSYAPHEVTTEYLGSFNLLASGNSNHHLMFRTMETANQYIDWCSKNPYMLAKDEELKEMCDELDEFFEEIENMDEEQCGSYIQKLHKNIKQHHDYMKKENEKLKKR